MYYLMAKWQSFKFTDRGATAVEYGLVLALIAAVIVTAVALLGTTIEAKFNDVAHAID